MLSGSQLFLYIYISFCIEIYLNFCKWKLQVPGLLLVSNLSFKCLLKYLHFLIYLFCSAGVKTRALCMLGKHSTTELHPTPEISHIYDIFLIKNIAYILGVVISIVVLAKCNRNEIINSFFEIIWRKLIIL